MRSNYIMQQHSRVHHEPRLVKEFSCQHEGCHFIARNAADARRHLLAHSCERNFACSEPGCNYRGKSLAQLRSDHTRIHAGTLLDHRKSEQKRKIGKRTARERATTDDSSPQRFVCFRKRPQLQRISCRGAHCDLLPIDTR
uniref:C2H2-type domain-containing protein n=1 Tax=Anopheles epiroticus TaxID=199890 RepID=A0A182PED8_9DIPT